MPCSRISLICFVVCRNFFAHRHLFLNLVPFLSDTHLPRASRASRHPSFPVFQTPICPGLPDTHLSRSSRHPSAPGFQTPIFPGLPDTHLPRASRHPSFPVFQTPICPGLSDALGRAHWGFQTPIFPGLPDTHLPRAFRRSRTSSLGLPDTHLSRSSRHPSAPVFQTLSDELIGV